MFDTIVKYGPFCISCIALLLAFLSYRLTRRTYADLKGDEVLVAGELHHPELQTREHRLSVLQATIFNKSKRKAHISAVVARDMKLQEIAIKWSDAMDSVGNVKGASQLVGVIDSVTLCIRRNDGEAFNATTVEVTHSFDSKPLILRFDPLAGWLKPDAADGTLGR